MEIFDICDEYGNPTGKTVTREKAHREGICNRTAHVWVVRRRQGKYQVLLKRRSMNKESFPGQLDTSSAGHIPAGDEPAESAVRELREELGIEAWPEDLEYAGQFRVKYEKEFHGKIFRDNEVTNVYIYMRDIPISDIMIQREELESADWYDLEETYQMCSIRNPEYCVPMGGLNVLMNKLGTGTVTELS